MSGMSVAPENVAALMGGLLNAKAIYAVRCPPPGSLVAAIGRDVAEIEQVFYIREGHAAD